MISVKDSGNNVIELKSTVIAGEHITHHNVDNSALPTGASTAANQALQLAALLAQATKLDNQPVTIASDSVGLATDANVLAVNTSIQNVLTAIGLLAKLTDTQPVEIVAGLAGLAADSSLQDILQRLVYPLNPSNAFYAEIPTDVVDQTPTILVSGVPGFAIQIHSLTIGNANLQFGSGSTAVGTWVHVVNQTDMATLRSFYAPPGSAKAYPVGAIVPFTGVTDDGVSVVCETAGAAVRASAVYTLI
jgi:hypothetical protein